MNQPPESHYEAERRQKLQKLRELGIDPYGVRTTGLAALAAVKAQYNPVMGHDGGPVVKVAGRIVLKRDMGKLSFLTLRDETGDLQVALDKRRLDAAGWDLRGLIDLGDQVVVEGPLGQTNKGETTIWATRLTLAAKSLLPPPAKWEGLSDIELRYRQRYVDLWANPDVMRAMKLRIRIVEEVRRYMRERGFIEVETPMMQALAGGAAARPFKTHHNALDIPLYLRIAPELYLKRLLVGGFSKVFELNRNFRNEGISPRHNPEFTMLEAYEAFGNWETMADLVEGMICAIAERVQGLPIISDRSGVTDEQIARRAYDLHQADPSRGSEANWLAAMTELTRKLVHRDKDGKPVKTISLARPWRRVSMAQLVEERTGWKFDKRPLQEANADLFHVLTHSAGKSLNLRGKSTAEQLVEVYEKLIEPTLIDPCFVTHVPSVVIPLARESREDPFFADVYELAINGQEISPGYTELNDPDVQAKHFAHQVGDKEEQQKTDEDFLTALRYGMPPAGGMGLGIDRLVMMLTGAESIRDVILFPLMRPQE
jgi:lysyl-tRNA synthetase class 2